MRISTPKEFRQRIEQVCYQHIKKWKEDHPLPEPPKPSLILADLYAGRAEANIDKLMEALTYQEDRDYSPGPRFGEVNVFECITTPTIQQHQLNVQTWVKELEEFKKELHAERDKIVDQVVFDGTAPYPLLNSFQNYYERISNPDKFDGK